MRKTIGRRFILEDWAILILNGRFHFYMRFSIPPLDRVRDTTARTRDTYRRKGHAFSLPKDVAAQQQSPSPQAAEERGTRPHRGGPEEAVGRFQAEQVNLAKRDNIE